MFNFITKHFKKPKTKDPADYSCPKCKSLDIEVDKIHDPQESDQISNATFVCNKCNHNWIICDKLSKLWDYCYFDKI